MIRFNKVFFVLLATVLVLIGCVEGDPINDSGSANNNGDEVKEGRGEIFTIARSTDARTMDPGNATEEGDMDILVHVFDGLVEFTNDELDVQPALATDWDTSEDGKVWTFNLRDDVKFHDGTDFNADAVVQSFMRLFDEDHPYYDMIRGSYSYTEFLLGDVIEDVVEVDEHTVEFHLSQNFSPFLTYMGYYSQFIVSPAALEEHGADFINNPVGTGPFKFVEWNEGEYVELEKNEDYWGEDNSNIDTLVFKVVPESSTRFLELQSGEVQAIKGLNPDQHSSIEENDDLELITQEGTNIFELSINTTKAPFDDVKVRQALNYAVDQDRIIEYSFKNTATKAINFLPPSVFGFDESTGSYDYDPEKAKELLKEAGYEDGFELKLYAFEGARPYVSNPIQSGELIADNLRDIGLDVEIVTNEWATHIDILENKEHDLGMHGYFDIGHPNNFLNTLALQGANTGFESEELREAALEALEVYDEDVQKELYKKIQTELHKAATIIPISHNQYSVATSKNVTGFEQDVLGIIHADKVEIE